MNKPEDKMGVYIRNRTIWINFIYKGVRCYESLKMPDTKQNRIYAERLLAEIKNKINLDIFNYYEYFPNSKRLKIFGIKPKPQIKFSNYAKEWILKQQKKYDAKLLKYSTLKSYKIGVKKLEKAEFWNKYIDKINSVELQDYITDLSLTLSAKTVNNRLTPLRQIFNNAYLENIIEKNPMDKIKNLSIAKPEIEPFTQEEISYILNYIRQEYHHIYAFFAVLFFTGMRVGEALAMKWKNFDFNNWTYHIKENRVDGRLTSPKTLQSKRVVKIIKPLQEAINNHKQYTFMKGSFVFLTFYNKPFHKTAHINNNYWKPSLKELGIKYRPMRQLRHTHAILSLIAGDNPHDIAKRLGHTSLQMLFNKYARFLKGDNSESRLENLFAKSQEKDVTISLH